MTYNLLDILRCPACRSSLAFADSSQTRDVGVIVDAELQCSMCRTCYPIISGVARFVKRDRHSESFGFQWKTFGLTQLDSHTKHPISRERFFRQSRWSAEEMRGKRVLDVGCGAGRFVEIALSTGATVVAVDSSIAADACWTNHGTHPNLNVIQADIYSLPFQPHSFDYVYCFGVLQHTPHVKRAFLALPEQLRSGGRLAVDLYPKLFQNLLWPKYWLRPVTKRIPPQRLLPIVRGMVATLLPVSKAIGRIPLVGRKLRHVIPVVNYDGILPLSGTQLRDWSVLDTLDMLSPAHDHPQSVDTLTEWFHEAGLRNAEVYRDGLIVGRGVQQ